MWSFEQIEVEVDKLHADIKKHAGKLWPNTPPSPIFMCDPEAACRLLGLEYLPDSHLGSFGGTATAGMLDRKNRRVMLSSKQSFEAMRFTAAHELGHWGLHADQQMFRDRSLSAPGGPGQPRPEQEANSFGACFLMPRDFVRMAVNKRFPVHMPIINSGVICFNLSARDHQYLEGLPPGSLQFAEAVARTEYFNGVTFRSMARLFNVSPTAMGIRLLELGFVA